MNSLYLALATFVLTIACVPAMWALSRRWNLTRSNFKGNSIPAGFGFLLVLVLVPIYVALTMWHIDKGKSVAYLVTAAGFGIIGLVDDLYGTREAGGFGGHLRLLRKGKISTGLIKAFGGGLLAFVLGFALAGFRVGDGLVNGFLISLSANLLNLLDLRPGRAVSCFWLGIVLLVLTHLGRLSVWPQIAPILVPAAALTALDRSARVMLGDAGSNALGALLGLSLAYEVGLPAKIVLVVLFAAVHLYSEKHSISKLIESNAVLSRLDRLLGER